MFLLNILKNFNYNKYMRETWNETCKMLFTFKVKIILFIAFTLFFMNDLINANYPDLCITIIALIYVGYYLKKDLEIRGYKFKFKN